MFVVMDSRIEKVEERFEPEFGRFEEQVMNAEWQRPELQLGLRPAVRHRDRSPAEGDIEVFLNTIYCCQE